MDLVPPMRLCVALRDRRTFPITHRQIAGELGVLRGAGREEHVVDTVADVQQQAHRAGNPGGAVDSVRASIHGAAVCLIYANLLR